MVSNQSCFRVTVLAVCLIFNFNRRVAGSGNTDIQVNYLEISETTAPDQWLSFQRSVNYTAIVPNKQILNKDGATNKYLNWFSVTVGGFHSCAIRRYFDSSVSKIGFGAVDHSKPTDAPGMMFCWGMDTYGQTKAMPPFGRPPLQCDTPDVCWDLDDGWRNLSAGWLHTCGILANGTMYCWGNNRQNQLGDSQMLISNGLNCSVPGIADNCRSTLKGQWALTPAGGVAAGRQHTCAIRCDPQTSAFHRQDKWVINNRNWGGVNPSTCNQGEVVCWGYDQFNQSMNGFRKTGWANYKDFISVCAGAAHSCAVRKGGQAICWGYNANNRAKIPQQYSTFRWVSIKCKGAHTCALATKDSLGHTALACWGHNAHNQTVVPRYQKKNLVPQNFSTVPSINILVYDRSWVTFSVGEYTTCALWEQTESEMACNTVNSIPPALNGECWGDGSYSQGTLPSRRIGHQLKDICRILQWKAVETGSYHSCGITIDDVGASCQQEGTCDEYPAPVGKQLRGAITFCPRGVFGTSALLQDINPALAKGFDANSIVPCVPIRTNQMRCWGLDTYKQLDLPGSTWRISPGYVTLSISCFVVTVIMFRW